jgi:hypothetical protein
MIGAEPESDDKNFSQLHNFEKLMAVGKIGERDANDRHVVSQVDRLL